MTPAGPFKDPVAVLRELRPQLQSIDILSDGDHYRPVERLQVALRRIFPPEHQIATRVRDLTWFPSNTADTEYNDESYRKNQVVIEELLALADAAIFELEEFGASDDVGPPTLAEDERRLLEPVLLAYRQAEDAGELDALEPDARAELAADMQTVDAQARSPRPKRGIVREALRSARSIAESVTAAGLVLLIDTAIRTI